MPEGTIDPSKWLQHKNLRTMNFLLFFPLLSIFTLGFDGSMMNGLQAVEGWRSYFGEPRGATLGLFNGAYPIGGLVAVPFISTLNDYLGRRWGIAVGAIVCIIGATLQGAAQNLAMFVVSRGIIGAGAVLIQAAGGPLIAEIAHPRHRATATALFMTSYALGSICAAWTTFGSFRIDSTWSWRIPSLLQGAPSVIQLLGIFFVPESPRWLISRGRDEEALQMLSKYHAEGNENDPLVQFEYNEIREAVAIDKANDGDNILQKYWEFMKTPGNRKRAFLLTWCACISQMSGNAFISYYLSPILAQVGLTTSLQQTLINATSQMLSWFSALYFATLPAKVGRRVLFLGALICVFICLVAITAGSAVFAENGSRSAGIAVVAFIYLFSPAYNLGLNPNLGLYITEIVPYNLRLRGMAVFQFWNLGFILFSTFAIPVGLEAMGWKLYCIFVAWVFVEFVVVWWTFPETKGPSLEEIAAIFDGPQEIHGGKLESHLEEKRGTQTVEQID
ncbi:general substrate transporter [Corynespora cassiicola Philippines]|uniref:General substrate transporter n=1 Tax=Corynespora cassiicola Philippines TaxID=1448308 RepID=A0A2T2NK14_CORCC|nr:general substrate transporter [Corynespora cassiicola Philippines]